MRVFFFSSRRRHTRLQGDWSSDVCSSNLVVVIGGGYAGINAARELARRGVAVTLIETHTLGWGASTRNGGIVHAGYKWSARQLIERYGPEAGAARYLANPHSHTTLQRRIDQQAV